MDQEVCPTTSLLLIDTPFKSKAGLRWKWTKRSVLRKVGGQQLVARNWSKGLSYYYCFNTSVHFISDDYISHSFSCNWLLNTLNLILVHAWDIDTNAMCIWDDDALLIVQTVHFKTCAKIRYLFLRMWLVEEIQHIIIHNLKKIH